MMERGAFRSVAWLVVSVVVSGCANTPSPRVANEPAAVAPVPFAANRAPVGLVLSGGAARGFAHVGVLKVLEENGIRPDIIVGSSAGSIVGALYASGLNAGQVEAALGEMSGGTFTDVFPGLGLLPGQLGVLRGEKLRVFVRDRLRHELIEDFPMRFAAVATNLRTGQSQVFNAGDASLAVAASSAVPGILAPVEIRGGIFGDGQIASPLPVRAARQLGAKVVVAVDVLYPPGDAAFSTALGVMFQAFIISVNRLRDCERAEADVVIEPKIPRTTAQFGLSARGWLIETGEVAAKEAMPAIIQALERRRAP